MAEDAAPLPAFSVGVEEELLLVDPGTGATVPAATEVCHGASTMQPAGDEATVHAQWSDTQVEAVTGRCPTLDEVARRLTHNRVQLTTAARAADVWPVPSGCSVLGGPVAPRPRFAAAAETYAGAVGTDTGYASWRAGQRSRLPAPGMPPHFPSVRAYEARVSRLVDQGALADDASPLWLARPVPRPSGVEPRVADTGIDVEATLLQAALTVALVRTALADLDAGSGGTGDRRTGRGHRLDSPSRRAVARLRDGAVRVEGPWLHPRGRPLCGANVMPGLASRSPVAGRRTRCLPGPA